MKGTIILCSGNFLRSCLHRSKRESVLHVDNSWAWRFSDTSAEDHYVSFYTLFPYSFQFLFESGEFFYEFVVRPPGLAQHRLLHQCSLVCAQNEVVRCRDDDPSCPFFESFAAVHRGHFYFNPFPGTLLSTDDYCNPSTILNS